MYLLRFFDVFNDFLYFFWAKVRRCVRGGDVRYPTVLCLQRRGASEAVPGLFLLRYTNSIIFSFFGAVFVCLFFDIKSITFRCPKRKPVFRVRHAACLV